MYRYTDYGMVTITDTPVAVEADGAQLYAWANRPGALWPASLLDLEGHSDDLLNEELSAWSSDVLGAVLPHDHPAYFVSVGQYA